ncbi:MAG: hypothetical protein KBG73_15600 [Candidatus Promineofilum sp.]|nr:hypothetical protein [Promineifilum sp.]
MTDTTPAQAATPEPQAGDGQQTELEQPKTPLTAEELAAALKKTREEAADYRRKLRDAEAKNEAADKARADAEAASLAEQGKYKELWEKAQADAQAAAAKLAQMEHDQQRRDAAQAAGIPALWQRLQGATAEELAEDAKALAAVVAPAPSANGQQRTATTAPTPAPQGHNGLTPEERRARARPTF